MGKRPHRNGHNNNNHPRSVLVKFQLSGTRDWSWSLNWNLKTLDLVKSLFVLIFRRKKEQQGQLVYLMPNILLSSAQVVNPHCSQAPPDSASFSSTLGQLKLPVLSLTTASTTFQKKSLIIITMLSYFIFGECSALVIRSSMNCATSLGRYFL